MRVPGQGGAGGGEGWQDGVVGVDDAAQLGVARLAGDPGGRARPGGGRGRGETVAHLTFLSLYPGHHLRTHFYAPPMFVGSELYRLKLPCCICKFFLCFNVCICREA